MAALELGDIEDFPFLDPPDRRQVRDGIRLLQELRAIDDEGRLTQVGRRLAQLQVDPRMGRMILEAGELDCAAEVIPIVAALSIQDPRERPQEQRAQADQQHARFADETSDFLAYLNLWRYLREQQRALSGSQFRKRCKAEYLHYLRVREWQDLAGELRRSAKELGISLNQQPAEPAAVHRALLSGLLSHVGVKDAQGREYLGARGARFAIFPGSGLAKKPPAWAMVAELVETSRLWGRDAARIDPKWVEPLAEHLVNRSYSEPRWVASRASVVATERVTLYGLPIVTGRTVQYGRIDPVLSRELFIRRALVEGEWETRHAFWAANQALLEEVDALEQRARRRDLRVSDEALFAFYDERIPADVVSGAHFDRWWRDARNADPDLLTYTRELLVADDAADTGAGRPSEWKQGELVLPLSYRFEPGAEHDGVTVHVPLKVLPQLRESGFDWLVPAFREELVTALIRSLPKDARRRLVPVPEVAAEVLAALQAAQGPLRRPGRGRARPAARRAGDARRLRRGAAARPPADDVPGRGRARRGGGRGHRPGGAARAGAPAAARRAGERGARPGDDRADGVDHRRAAEGRRAAGDRPGGARLPGARRRGRERRGAGAGDARRAGDRDGGRHAPAAAARRAVADPRRAGGPDQRAAARARRRAARRRRRRARRRHDRRARRADRRGGRARLGRRRPSSGCAGHVAGRLQAKTAEVVAQMARILDAARDVERRLEGLSAPAFEPARRDVRAQLARLVHPGFATRTGAARLPDVERYLQGAARRLERLPDATAVDRDRMNALARAGAGLPAAAARPGRAGRAVPAGLREVPWMLEELRISQFAQGLGTRGAGVGEADPARAGGGRGLAARATARSRDAARPRCGPARTGGVRRRRRSSFSSTPDGMGRVRWLQPAGVQRRPRRRPPVVPILLLLVLVAGAAGAGYVLLAREAAGDRRQDAVDRFVAAWERGDYPAMWRTLSPERRRDWPLAEFAASYRIAAQQATIKSVEVQPGPRARRRPRAGARARPHARLRGAARHDPAAGRRPRRRGVPRLVARLAAAGPARRRERAPARARAARAAPDPRRRRQPAGGRADDGGDHRHARRPAASRARACRRSTTSGSAAAPARSCASASGSSSASRSSAAARCARRCRRGCSGSPPRRSATGSAAWP